MKPRWLLPLACVVGLVVPGCGDAKPPVATPPIASSVPSGVASSTLVEPAEPPARSLHAGALVPIDHDAPLQARVVARHLDGAFEIVELGLGSSLGREWAPSHVVITGGVTAPVPVAVAAQRFMGLSRDVESFVYVRRPRTDGAKPIVGKIHTSAGHRTAGQRFSFAGPPSVGAKEDPRVGRRWAEAMGSQLGHVGSFASFAVRRLSDLFPEPPVPKTPRGRRPAADAAPPGGVMVDSRTDFYPDDLQLAMDTLSGAESVQQAIQTRRPLLARGKEKGSVSITTLIGPKLERHPWAEMERALGKKPPPEPLAAAVPADSWYVRAKDLGALFRLLDETDQWGTPLATQLDGRGEDRALAARYEAELGLSRGPLARAFGPDVIGELCATGSDPYLREGSDVTLVFRVKNKPAFDAGSAITLAAQSSAHGGVDTTSFVADGVTVSVARSKDGVIRQHRASVGDLEIVSNSPGGIRRVLATMAKKSPSLSDEPDFRFMLARDDTAPADVLAFAGDRFILAVAGPKQKIAESRRQIALAELQTPAYAALLFGMTTGQSPTTVEELTKAKLLLPGELEHRPKDPITFQPGSAPRSAWGTPGSLTPLVDLEPLLDVTMAEKTAYERFAQMYNRSWAEYVDPIALRVSASDAGLTAELRVLPIVSSRSYRELQGQVGSARVSVPPLSSGIRLVAGIGQDADLRRDLSSSARHSLLGDIGIDWLGEWAMIGAADRSSLLSGPWDRELDPLALPPTDEELSRRHRGMFGETFQIFAMPLFGAVQVKSTAAASIALIGMRKLAQDAAGGAVQWGEHATYRGATIVRILAKDNEFPDGGLSIFYAMDGDVILVALREGILRKLLDDRRDEHSPATSHDAAASTQLVLEADLRAGAVSTLASWFLELAAMRGQEASRLEAWALLRGAPETAKDPARLRALALAYFGEFPVPPDGGAYSLEEDGVHDPARGSAHAPIFPVLPLAGSPAERTLRRLSGVRIETSFDDEPRAGAQEAVRSLHTRILLRSK